MNAPFSAAELQHLLARPVRAVVGPADRAQFCGKRVVVTGAGGSIGSELARELAACRPALLSLVDFSELALFALEREIRDRWPAVPLDISLTDVTRGAAIERVCRTARPDVVYHAAAYKHVTMAERAPAAAALVNVIGTAETALAAANAGARFVLISSDKAADPKSVMGATKQLAERIVLAMASDRFRPVVVRFGNVLGSSGSVLQIMRDCVRRGVPIPITDPQATRFFMTAGEAVALVLRADLLGRAADIFWLEMGRPIRLAELATRLVSLEASLGFTAVPVQVIGLRPGEKRNEVLADPQLVFDRTIDRRIRVARQTAADRVAVGPLVARLRRATARANDLAVLDVLTSMPGGFAPSALALDHARRASARSLGATDARKGRAA